MYCALVKTAEKFADTLDLKYFVTVLLFLKHCQGQCPNQILIKKIKNFQISKHAWGLEKLILLLIKIILFAKREDIKKWLKVVGY